MDNLSNRRVRKNGQEGQIFNCVSVGVRWNNGSMYPVRLESLEFLDSDETDNLQGNNIKDIPDLNDLITRYEKELEEGDYSVVDGSTELERVIKDLKKLIK